MARKRKSRCKDKTPPIIKGANARQNFKARNRAQEVVSRKRKAVSQMPRQSSRLYKKLKSSSSVELIRVSPCCSGQEGKKYAKLGLDSALFLSSSKPAKRRQSHISVVTISSSDDEDLSYDKTADWISKMDTATVNTSSNEEPFPSGDADFSQNSSMIEEILDAEKFRPQKSCTELCSTPESTFKPLCASTPQDKLSIVQPLHLNTPEKEENNLLIYKGQSFLENPVKDLRQHLTTLHVSESPCAIASSKQNQRDDEYQIKPDLSSSSCSPKFYFGTALNLPTLQETLENTESRAPTWSDFSYFGCKRTVSTTNANTVEQKSQNQEIEGGRYSLAQIPSTSHAPVSDPLLEVTPKKKRSKSRNKYASQ